MWLHDGTGRRPCSSEAKSHLKPSTSTPIFQNQCQRSEGQEGGVTNLKRVPQSPQLERDELVGYIVNNNAKYCITIFKETRVLVAQSCPTLCDPTDCSPPGSSVHGILQARILEWVAISFSKEAHELPQRLLNTKVQTLTQKIITFC